jgi:membrane fusion protein (multidrug efflux system)
MRPQRVRQVAGLLLLACAVLLVGVWQLTARNALTGWDPNVARKAGRPIPVRTVKVASKDLQETIGGTAVTVPALTALISIPSSSSEVADREVKQVEHWPGDAVRRGQALMEFEPVLFQHVVHQRQAMLDKTRQELKTMFELHEQRAASGLQLKDAEVAVTNAELELAMAERDLELCTIESPIDGVLEQVNVVPQMRVGGNVTLAVVHQIDPIFVEMDFPMERIDSLQLNQTADVTLDAFPQETFTGTIVRIAPVVSTKTRVLPVTISVPNPGNRIRAGISGFVRVQSVKTGATAVPTVAVIKNKNKAMVVCIEDQRARIREIEIGPVVESGQIEVLNGLRPGDEVVVYGQDAVEENDLVNVNWHGWTRREDMKKATQ